MRRVSREPVISMSSWPPGLPGPSPPANRSIIRGCCGIPACRPAQCARLYPIDQARRLLHFRQSICGKHRRRHQDPSTALRQDTSFHRQPHRLILPAVVPCRLRRTIACARDRPDIPDASRNPRGRWPSITHPVKTGKTTPDAYLVHPERDVMRATTRWCGILTRAILRPGRSVQPPHPLPLDAIYARN